VKRIIFRRLFVLAVVVLLPANALAAALAYVSASALNLRIGPGTNYEVITSLPEGTPVALHGYGSRGRWCDVSVDDLRGWVWCAYLDSGVPGPILTWGPVLGLSILAYSYDDYYDRYYYDRYYDDGYRTYDGDRYRDLEPDKHRRKHEDARHRDHDRSVKTGKQDLKRKTVRHRDSKRDLDVKSDKRKRKHTTVHHRSRDRDVKSGKRDHKGRIVGQRDRHRDFKSHNRDRTRKIRHRGGGGKCGSSRRCGR
jgi:uncharacterized protein YraI